MVYNLLPTVPEIFSANRNLSFKDKFCHRRAGVHNNSPLHNMLNSIDHTPGNVSTLVMFAENWIDKRLTLRDMLQKGISVKGNYFQRKTCDRCSYISQWDSNPVDLIELFTFHVLWKPVFVGKIPNRWCVSSQTIFMLILFKTHIMDNWRS